MLNENAKNILASHNNKNLLTLIEQIKYLDELERNGIIEHPVPQTAHKYPTLPTLNDRT